MEETKNKVVVPERIHKALLKIGIAENETVDSYLKMLDGKEVQMPFGTEILTIDKRPVTPLMCAALISMFRYYRDRQLDLLTYATRADLLGELIRALEGTERDNLLVEFDHLYHFDLIELAQREVGKDEYEVIPDQYRLSDNGIRFTKKEVGLPPVALLFQDEVFGHDTSSFVMINDVLGQRGWDYDAMFYQ